MTLFTLIAVFTTIFVAIACLAYAITVARSGPQKHALSRLDAIASSGFLEPVEEPLDLRRDDPLGAIPLLDAILRRLDITHRLNHLLMQAGLKWTSGKLVLLMLASLLTAFLLVWLRTSVVFLSIVLGCCCANIPLFYVFWKRNKRFYRFKELLPEALDTMVAAIRAGHSFNSALGMTARESMEPVKGELRQCFDEQNFGLELRTSLNNLERRVPLSDIRIMVAAILIQRETGGNLTEILERVSYLIREEFRLQRQVRVHTAQGRLTGWILSILPLILGFLLYLVNPKNMSLMWERPVGLKMLYGAAIMTTIGALIIRKIVRVRL